jgi:TatD family-associated radical SAM protein
MQTILYEVKEGLYINLTNRCPCNCSFCLRQSHDDPGNEESLWLDHEPSFAEVKDALDARDVNQYPEIVFCGFGEPMEAFDVLKETAAYLKTFYQGKIRLNTNGLGDLIVGRPVGKELAGLIDSVSISLNAADAVSYQAVADSCFGEKSFDAIMSFAGDCAKVVPEVAMTTVATTISEEDEKRCAEICANLGVKYRIRSYIE